MDIIRRYVGQVIAVRDDTIADITGNTEPTYYRVMINQYGFDDAIDVQQLQRIGENIFVIVPQYDPESQIITMNIRTENITVLDGRNITILDMGE